MNNTIIEIDEDDDLDPNACEWCERHTNDCGDLHEYKNKNYHGRFCKECIWLVDLASEAVEKDNS